MALPWRMCCRGQAYLDAEEVQAEGSGDRICSKGPAGPFDTRAAEPADSAEIATTVSTSLTEVGSSFEATIEKMDASEALGLRLETFDESRIYISYVADDDDVERAVARYNRAATQNRRICRGQYIRAVNGTKGVEAVQREMREASVLRVVVQRGEEFSVAIEMAGRPPLSLPVVCSERAGTSLVVRPAADSSADDLQSLGLVRGDRIVAVNGHFGSALEMLKELRADRSMFLLAVSRPAED
mmetsp:Transcript_893/g.2340  ORF Transcript_893/g.2340 Transcript_893/m.2340 type:complete len:242 (+) Transcript_893:84-809(+)